MDDAADIRFGVVNGLVHVHLAQAAVSGQFIREKRRTLLNMPVDDRPEFSSGTIRNDLGANRAMPISAGPLQQAHDGGFTLQFMAHDATGVTTFVHVDGLAADKGFVRFHDTRHLLIERPDVQSMADTVQHEPCGLLGNAKSPMGFPTAY